MRIISVTGNGKASGTPDIANYSISVKCVNKDPHEAMEQNTKKMKSLLKVIKQYKIEDKDFKTEHINVYPEIDYRNNHITGYAASNSVSIKVRDLRQSSTLAAELIKNGITKFNGPNFEIENPSSLKNEARKKAVEDAKRKASVFCQELNMQLGDLVRLSESDDVYGAANLGMACESGGVPMAKGEETVSVNVNIDFEVFSENETRNQESCIERSGN